MTDPAKLEHDFISRAIRFIEHNWATAGAVLIMGAVIAAPGCSQLQGKAADPTTGEVSTAAEIRASALATIRVGEARIADITTTLTVLKLEAEQIAASSDELAGSANEAIQLANDATERNLGWVKSGIGFVSSFVPAGSEGLSAMLGALTVGMLGDRLRLGKKIKRATSSDG